MRAISILVSVLAVVLLGMVAVGRLPYAIAQDASPTPNPFAGITRQPLVKGNPAAAPELAIVMVRVTFEPGACTPPHTHPGGVAFYVDSGTFTWTSIIGPVTVTRATTAGTPAATETAAKGEQITLGPGDSVFEPDRHGEVLCNTGTEPGGGVATYFVEADEPLTTMTNLEGTPVPMS
jgi:hypothetical protein